MIFQLKERRPLRDGEAYYAQIAGIQEVKTKSAGRQCVVTFDLEDEDECSYSQVKLWIGEIVESGTVEWKLFKLLDMNKIKNPSVDDLRKLSKNKWVGIVIKYNQKNGNEYWNIADFFDGDDDLEKHSVNREVDFEDDDDEYQEYEDDDEEDEDEDE